MKNRRPSSHPLPSLIAVILVLGLWPIAVGEFLAFHREVTKGCMSGTLQLCFSGIQRHILLFFSVSSVVLLPILLARASLGALSLTTKERGTGVFAQVAFVGISVTGFFFLLEYGMSSHLKVFSALSQLELSQGTLPYSPLLIGVLLLTVIPILVYTVARLIVKGSPSSEDSESSLND